MFTTYWAVKGGAGATVLAAAHALRTAAIARPTVVVDLDGDLGAALGIETGSAGVADWLVAGDDVPADGLDRLLVPVVEHLSLLPRGEGDLRPRRARVLGNLLAAMPREVVVDAGTRPGPAACEVARHADRSVLVTRACYLAMRRVSTAGLAPTEVALVREPQRALDAEDIAGQVGVPVRTVVPVEPGIARAVDAGLLASRLPRGLRRAIPAEAMR